MSEWILIAGKAAAPGLGKVAVSGIRRFTLNLRVARSVRSECRWRELPVPAFARLTTFLRSERILDAFQSGDFATIADVPRKIQNAQLTRDWTIDARKSEVLATVLLAAFTRALDPSSAVLTQVQSAKAEIIDEFRASIPDQNALTLAPPRMKIPQPLAAEVPELEPIWPQVGRFLSEFCQLGDKSLAIHEWVDHRPEWMANIPSAGLLWFAELADAYGLHAEGSKLIVEALASGASPRSFWSLKQALLTAGNSREKQIREIAKLADSHPAADSILKYLDGNLGEASAILELWIPTSAAETSFKETLSLQYSLANDRVDEARQVAESLLSRGHVTAGQIFAEALLRLGNVRESQLHFTWLNEAQETSLRARDETRSWGGNSWKAAYTAARAAIQRGNPARALQIVSLSPEGEATQSEASNKYLANLRLTLQSSSSSPQQLREAIEASESPFARAAASAQLADREGKDAFELWKRAMAQAEEDHDKLQIGMALAQLGYFAPELDTLRPLATLQVEELKLLSTLFAGEQGAEQQVRSRARSSQVLTVGLANFLQAKEQYLNSGEVLLEAGKRWGNANFCLEAANLYFRVENYVESAEAARHALSLAPPKWDYSFAAHARHRDAWIGLGNWTEAANAATDAFIEHQHDAQACWALVYCQVRLLQDEKAWDTYTRFGNRPAPTNSQQSRLLVHLLRSFEPEGSTLETIFGELDRWPEDRDLRKMAAETFLFYPAVNQGARESEVAPQLAKLLSEFSDVFIPQEFDEDDIQGSLQALVDQIPDTSEIDEHFRDGNLPFGFAATIHNRSIAELLITRSGPFFALAYDRFEAEVEQAQVSRERDCAVDITAIATIGYFDTKTEDLITGYPKRVLAPLTQKFDATRGARNLASKSTLTLGRSHDGSPKLYAISEEEAETRHKHALELRRRFDALQVIERTWTPHLQDAGLGEKVSEHVWADALDLAIHEDETCLWSDDRRLRDVAQLFDVPTFGTDALIEALRRGTVFSNEEAQHLHALLISKGFAGSYFNPEAALAGAELESWRPDGTARYLAWSDGGSNALEIIEFIAEAVRHNAENPGAIESWCEALALWVVRASGAENITSNLALFLRDMLSREWIIPPMLPFIVAGIRRGISSEDVSDPFEQALRGHYNTIVQQADPKVAYFAIQGMVGFMNNEDRTLVTRIAFV